MSMKDFFHKFDLNLKLLVYFVAFIIPLSVPATRIGMKLLLVFIILKFILRNISFDRIDLSIFSVSLYQLIQSVAKGLTLKFLSKPNGIYPSFLFLARKVDFNPETALRFFLTGSFLLAVAFIFQAFTGVNVKHLNFQDVHFIFPPERPDRPSAFLGHPLTVGGVLSTALIVCVKMLLEKRSKFELILLPILFLAIIVSFDRSYWISLFMSFGILAFHYKRFRKIYVLFFLIFSVSVLSLPNLREKVMATFYLSKREGISRINYESSVCRLLIWKSSFQMFSSFGLKDKLFGISEIELKKNLKPTLMKNYLDFEKRYNYEFSQHEIFNHLHNNFLQFLIAYGLVGLAFFIYLFLFILKFNYSAFRETGYTEFIMFLVIYLNWLVAGMFEYNFGDEAVKFLMFLTMAINVKLFDKIASSKAGGKD